MTTNPNTAAVITGVPVRVKPVVTEYAHVWQRPSGVILGGFLISDNSTSVSAAECRPL